ncbi:MAG: hypothetical protein K1X28_05385 [Parachlamydiales bacterium]|nr:hypothetical protein [Parachlamydiales bacterium]
MRFLKVLTSFLFLMSLNANQTSEKLTGFFISGIQYYGSADKEEAFFLCDGDFSFKKGAYKDGIAFSFNRLDKDDNWVIEFHAPNKDLIKVGVYKNARRHPFNGNAPGITVTHNHSSSDGGEFEILELKYDRDGEIVSFAANFVSGSSLFGSIRFNSSIPVEKRFKKFFHRSADRSVVYLSQINAMTGEKTQPVRITDDSSTIAIQKLPFGGDGIEVLVKGHLEKWTFDFAAPIGTTLKKGRYETSYRYPFHGYLEAGIGLSKSRTTAAMPVGFFEVIDIQRDKNDLITKLNLNFEIETEEREIFTGTVDYTFSPIETSSSYDEE